jgi:hypothetical protein
MKSQASNGEAVTTPGFRGRMEDIRVPFRLRKLVGAITLVMDIGY